MTVQPSLGAATRAPVSTDQLDGLVTVLHLVRSGQARTRPELARLSGMGRGAVTQRVAELLESGLLVESEIGRSTGGGPPPPPRGRAAGGGGRAGPPPASARPAGGRGSCWCPPWGRATSRPASPTSPAGCSSTSRSRATS